MKKILTILLLLILAGCTGTSDNVPSKNADIYKGSEGIVMNFIPSAPPENVYENHDFRVGLLLKNRGAGEPANGVIILGYEEDYMETSDTGKESYSIESRTLSNPVVKQEQLFFEFKAKEIDQLSTHHLSTIYATTCYSFETVASSSICIDTDIFNERRSKKVCAAKDVSLSNQGAPVAVTKIEESMITIDDTRIKPVFKIYIDNIGNGQIIAPGSIDKVCSSQGLSRTDDLNIISVNAKLGSDSLTCTPSSFRLTNSRNFITCELSSGILSDLVTYNSIITVTLTYGYTYTVSTNIDIKPLND